MRGLLLLIVAFCWSCDGHIDDAPSCTINPSRPICPAPVSPTVVWCATVAPGSPLPQGFGACLARGGNPSGTAPLRHCRFTAEYSEPLYDECMAAAGFAAKSPVGGGNIGCVIEYEENGSCRITYWEIEP